MSAMTTVPAHSDPHAFFPIGYIAAHGIYDAHHFVTRYPWILNAWNATGYSEHIAVTHPAGLHFDAHLARLGFWDIALDDLEIGIWLGYLNDCHARHGKIS